VGRAVRNTEEQITTKEELTCRNRIALRQDDMTTPPPH